MDNLEKLAGGTINSWGGINDRYYQPTNHSVNNNGTIFNGYSPVGRIDSAGNIRTGYDMLTDLRVEHGCIVRDRSW